MSLSDLTSATPDTSSEEIKDYAEQVIKDIEADRAGETKPDAQIVSEHSDVSQTKTPAEEKSGSNTAQDESEESGHVTESQEWLTDDVKAEAAAYGIDEAELADFASREELNRAFRILDKTALAAGQKSIAESEGTPRNEKGQFTKKEEPTAENPKQETRKEGRFEIPEEFKELYDDTIVNTLTGMRDHYESRLEALEAHFMKASVLAEEQRFDSEIDKLEMPKLFGVTGKETADELKRREDVLAQAKVLQAGHRHYGRDVAIETLVKRSAQMVFSSEFDKQLLKQKTRKISKQSDSRMGGSPVRPLPPSDDPREAADKLYREMERA